MELHFNGQSFVLSDKDVNALDTLKEMSNNEPFETVWQKGGNFRTLNPQYNWLTKHYCEDYGELSDKGKTVKRQFATKLLGIMTKADGVNYRIMQGSEEKISLNKKDVIGRITKRLNEAFRKREYEVPTGGAIHEREAYMSPKKKVKSIFSNKVEIGVAMPKISVDDDVKPGADTIKTDTNKDEDRTCSIKNAEFSAFFAGLFDESSNTDTVHSSDDAKPPAAAETTDTGIKPTKDEFDTFSLGDKTCTSLPNFDDVAAVNFSDDAKPRSISFDYDTP